MNQQNGNSERILRVGIHLMARNGYRATSTREIVEQSHVTKPMLYYYYGCKEGLCRAGIQRFGKALLTELHETLDDTRALHELVIDYIWTIFRFMQENQDEGTLYMSLLFGPERQSFLADVMGVMAEVRKLTLFLVEKLVRAGILRTGCEDEFAQSLRGMIDVWLWTATTEGTTLNRATAERIVENLLNGFSVE